MAVLIGVLALVLAFWKDLAELISDPHERSVFLWAIILLVFGTIFYSRVEGWSLIDSFYFSVVTLTTVGYGDLTPDTPLAKLFTTVYILLGLSIIAVFVSNLARARIQRIAQRRDDDESKQDLAELNNSKPF